jgi:hypothetical protein
MFIKKFKKILIFVINKLNYSGEISQIIEMSVKISKLKKNSGSAFAVTGILLFMTIQDLDVPRKPIRLKQLKQAWVKRKTLSI